MNTIKTISLLMRGLLMLVLAAGMLQSAGAQETVEYIHTDALGSPVAITDSNGNVIERTVYEPYGAVVGGQVKDRPGYTGHVSDSATGLSYMQQRYMDPEIGAFLSVDPVAASQEPIAQFARYRYANGNPYRFKDPNGSSAVAIESLLIPAIVLTTAYYSTPPEQRAAIGRGIDAGLKQAVKEIKQLAESALGESGGKTPPLPEGLVGDQSSPLAGPNKSGNKHTSGNLTPENGGVGDYDADLKTLAGDTRPAVQGDSAPPGAQIGANGVFGRSENSSGGKSIDIPANGDKPHETLHY